MPRCKSCGVRIMDGRFCDVCEREWEFEHFDREPAPGPEYIECEFCQGKSYIWKNGTKRDCPVCDGFGKVRINSEIITDGGIIIDDDRDDQEIVIAEDGGEVIDE